MSHLKLKVTSWGEIHLDKKELRALMRAAGNDVKRKTAALIARTGGGGRTYRLPGGKSYVASAPGEPPVMLSGALRTSLRTYVYQDGDGFAVRERQFYSLFLEAGARGGGNRRQRAATRRQRRARVASMRVLLPRPHLDKVIEDEKPNIDRRVRKAFEQGLTWRQTR